MARVLLSCRDMNVLAIVLALAVYSPDAHFNLPERSAAKVQKVPAIVEVQKKAIEHARLDPSEITSWKKRVKYKALLPRLQIEYDRRVKYDVNVDVNDSIYVGSSGVQVGPEEGTYAANQNNDQNVIVKAVWDFSETIFNPDMLSVSEETRLLARERQAILAEVNRNYYERERIAGELSRLAGDAKKKSNDEKLKQEIFTKQVSLNEANAALDALTGGWFSKQIAEVGREN